MHAHILGSSKIGPNRELKFAIENFWDTKSIQSEFNVIQIKNNISNLNWKNQINIGLDYITVGDFSYYDNVLNNLIYLGCIPSRFKINTKNISLNNYFELARGNSSQSPMELTKWFNTNYHYLIPEFDIKTKFSIKNNWLFNDIKKSKLFNYPIKVSLLGPISILKLGKIKDNELKNRLLLLPSLIINYIDLINKINSFKINFIQIEEPILSTDLSDNWIKSFKSSYLILSKYFSNLILTSYFGEVNKYINFILSVKNLGIHLDINNLELNFLKNKKYIKKFLSLGIIDGKNIWKNDLENSYYLIKKIKNYFKNIFLSTTTSLMHVPINLNKEKINKNIKNWLSFGLQKIEELILLKNLLIKKNKFLDKNFIKNIFYIEDKKKSNLISNYKIQNLIKNLNKNDFKYRLNYNLRKLYQKIYLNLPNLTSTSIGSFPQTKKIRNLRLKLKKKNISKKKYIKFIKNEIKYCINKQINLDFDVLVHGEFERNDMVEYFANLLNGFIITDYGWVQSFGTRYVKPPIIYGDIYMPKYMTIKWIKYTQSLTKKYVKGILTGPITILKWSFCRNDQPLYITALQLSLALREEILELERNNIKIIQIDEPALRELLPLNKNNYPLYFNWVIKSIILFYQNIKPYTQIHSHICYSEFKSILPCIKKIDLDIISIETSRSNMELLSILPNYINEIGVGIYDIHSKRILKIKKSIYFIKIIINHIKKNSIWINPDCGLKTRDWKEIKISLKNIINPLKEIKFLLNI
ncbi:5-methyltetrahydropteroyltriglutamate-- homocysteine methyltransferase [Candidatus Nasuia deltocephalinicola]|nr:5-methyltetrahydropteroyltriglutamate-- homocysteine methyltransferase [Candidatus Nasuia deltocephalinicola]